MSSCVPALGAWTPQADEGVVTDPRAAPPSASFPAFAPRQSRLISWPVRVARVAERVVARALPASQAPALSVGSLAEITLAGLDHVCRLSPSRQEVLAAERARLRIEQVIARRQERYRRFRELKRGMVGRPLSLALDGTSQLYLNPANAWVRWSADNGGAEAEPFAGSVLFFLDGDDLRGIRMRLEGQVLINELADYEPCTVAQWAELSALVGHAQLVGLVHHLVRIGLVAYG